MMRFCLVLMSLLTMSCIETTKHYVLNGDGSGKVLIEVKAASFQGEGKKSVKETIQQMLDGSSGVDTWADVSAKVLDDGRVQFNGTAYFKNLTALKIKNADDFKMTVESVDKTTKRLVLSNNNEKKNNPPPKKEDLTLGAQRAKYNQMKPMLSAFLATMKTDITIETSGTVTQIQNLKKDSKNRLILHFSGDKMLSALDELMADDAWLADQIKMGNDIQSSSPAGDILNQKLFGASGPITATLKGATGNLFDYGKETEKAKAEYESMLTALGLGQMVPAKLASGGDFKNIRVVKVSMSDIEDDDRVHFGTSKRYQLTLLGELPGAVLKITNGEIRSATADNGESLMPESDWDKEINWPQLSDGRNFVMFDLNLKLPSEDVRSISEISGVLQYEVGSHTQKLESPVSFTEGSTGVNGVSIEGIETQDGESVLKLEIDAGGQSLKGLTFMDANGKTLDAREQSWSSSGDKIWYTFALTGEWPAKGRVVLEVYDDLKTYELPFRVESIDLFGRSLK